MNIEERKQRGAELINKMLGEESAESVRKSWQLLLHASCEVCVDFPVR